MDIVQIIIDRIDNLEENLTSEIKTNRADIGSLKESAHLRRAACVASFATKSYVRRSLLVVLVIIAFSVTEPELLARAVKGLISLFN